MLTPLLPFALPGFVVEHVATAPPTLLIDARASTPEAVCPDCHAPSARVHSRYTRRLRDLPIAEPPMRLRLHVRRLRCPPHVSTSDLCRTPAGACPLARAAYRALDGDSPCPRGRGGRRSRCADGHPPAPAAP